ncbi:hypothetical protein ACPA0F_20210 [Solibacillus silvestris]
MNIFVSDIFNAGWKDSLAGGGNFSYSQNGRILQTNSITGASNGAFKNWHFVASAGDVIEISVFARALTGTPKIAVDLRNAGNAAVKTLLSEEVKGKDWKLYKFKVTIPMNSPSFTNVVLALGIFNSTSTASSGEYHSPRIEIKTNRASSQIIAQGMLRVANGVATLDQSYKNFGVSSVSYDDTTKHVIVNLDKPISYAMYPIVNATGIIDNNAFPIAGQWLGGDTPNFKIAFTNGTAKQSLATGTNIAFFTVTF